MSGRKRRSPGEGGCWPYMTNGGERWHARGPVRLADGTVKMASRKGFHTKTAGLEWLGDQQSAARKGEYIEPSKQRFGAYGAEVIDGLRVSPQTRASYRKNWRCHVEPYPVAHLPLAHLTGTRLTAHYRLLSKSGRKDHRAGEGLSARTVRYIATIIHGVLAQAVDDGLLARNPAQTARPPSAREAAPPEMTCWTAAQLAAFERWAGEHSASAALWYVLAHTGMRRGESLALRWRDVDLDTGTVRVRRSAGMVRYAGVSAEVVEGTTKSGKPRVVDLDAATVATWKAYRKMRGSMALQLVHRDALVFGTVEGERRNPEHTSRSFAGDLARCGKALGAGTVPVIRLHDLRHTHATILLTAREPVHVVSQRLGHASAVITMQVYAHVLPGSQREAADTFARLIAEAL